MVTIKDIAREAGVAKSTVSNVFTGRKYVSPEIKEKVLEICKRIDYQPNFFASTLSAKTKTNIIGLFLEESANKKYKQFYSSLIEGVLVSLSKVNNNLLIYSGLNEDDTTTKLKSGKSPIDGAIVLAPTVNDERISEFNKNLIPFVLIGHPSNQININFVDIDNVTLTKDITTKMIEKGYNNLCLINSNEKLVISKERNQGFQSAVSNYNNITSIIIHSDNSTLEDGYNYSTQLIKKGVNAIITASSIIAAGVYKACKEQNKQIGKDIVIFSLGYSNLPDLVFEPTLSYATQDYYKIGEMAAKKLYNIISNKPCSDIQTIDSEIHYHSSFRYDE